MTHRHDDKSVPTGYYKPEDAHDLSEPVCRINPSVPDEELGLFPGDALSAKRYSRQTSTQPIKNKREPLRSASAAVAKIPPRRLAFCGGGVRCIAHVGVLKALESEGILKFVKEVMGISAGALIAFLWHLSYTTEQIEKLAIEFDFMTLQTIEPESLLLFNATYGLDDGAGIVKLLTSILKQKGLSPDITFAELEAITKTKFRCYATELQTTKIRELSSEKTPKMKVLVAVRASMSFPIIFTPVHDGDSLLVDGALLHNLPLVFLTEAELEETWGILFLTKPKTTVKPVESIIELFQLMYDGVFSMRNAPFIKKFKERLIIINTNNCGIFNYQESAVNRKKLIDVSFKITREFLYYSNKPARRFSAA
jgi:predicted acylesterase/phospholipase RssA